MTRMLDAQEKPQNHQDQADVGVRRMFGFSPVIKQMRASPTASVREADEYNRLRHRIVAALPGLKTRALLFASCNGGEELQRSSPPSALCSYARGSGYSSLTRIEKPHASWAVRHMRRALPESVILGEGRPCYRHKQDRRGRALHGDGGEVCCRSMLPP